MQKRYCSTHILVLAVTLSMSLLGACGPAYEQVQLVEVGGGGFQFFQGSHCGITKQNAVVCWDNPLDDALPTIDKRYTLSGHLSQLTGNQIYTCLLLREESGAEGGQPYCWGYNVAKKPARLALPEPIRALSTGRSHTCGLGISGKAYCAGYNGYAQLGTGVSSRPATDVRSAIRWVPQEVSVIKPPIDAIAAGDGYTCAITSGAVSCWGRHLATSDSPYIRVMAANPMTLPSQTVAAASLHLADDYACMIAVSGDVYCWGKNDAGQLGFPAWEGRYAPLTRVPGIPAVTQLALGDGFACALSGAGEVYCWGHVHASFSTPRKLAGIKEPVRQIAAFGYHALALHPDGSVSWWERNGGAPQTAFVQLEVGWELAPGKIFK